MNGNIVVIGGGLMVSNNAVPDIVKQMVDTPEGQRTRNIKVINVFDPFGSLSKGETVDIAFQGDQRISSRGVVLSYRENKCTIEITEVTDNYNETIRRAKTWLRELQEN